MCLNERNVTLYIDNVCKSIYNEDKDIDTKGGSIMPSANVNIRMDSDLKNQFEDFCKDVGLTMTAAFNVFAKKAVSEQRIPFSIGRDLPNQETLKALAEVKRMKTDPNYGKRYKDVDAMMKELLSDV